MLHQVGSVQIFGMCLSSLRNHRSIGRRLFPHANDHRGGPVALRPPHGPRHHPQRRGGREPRRHERVHRADITAAKAGRRKAIALSPAFRDSLDARLVTKVDVKRVGVGEVFELHDVNWSPRSADTPCLAIGAKGCRTSDPAFRVMALVPSAQARNERPWQGDRGRRTPAGRRP